MKIYSAFQVFWGSFIGGPFYSIFVTHNNLRALKVVEKKSTAILIDLVIFGIWAGLNYISQSEIATYVINFGFALAVGMLTEAVLRKKETNSEIVRDRFWSNKHVAFVSVGILVAQLLFFVLVLIVTPYMLAHFLPHSIQPH